MNRTLASLVLVATSFLGFLGGCSSSGSTASRPTTTATTPQLVDQYEPVGTVPMTGGVTQIAFGPASTYALKRTQGPTADELLVSESGTYVLDLTGQTLTLTPTTPAGGSSTSYRFTVLTTSGPAPQAGRLHLTGGGLLSTILTFLFGGQTFQTDTAGNDAGTTPPPTMTGVDATVPGMDASIGVDATGQNCVLVPIDAGAPPHSAQMPVGSMNGIDVSHYQSGIDWPTVLQTNGFAYAKATEGTKYTDTSFASKWQAMSAAGMPRGAYHFFRAAQDAVTQADYFATALAKNGFNAAADLAPMIDVEVTDGVAASAVVSGVRAFINEAQAKLGVTLIVYTAPSFWTATLGNPDQSANPLWIAHYTTKPSPTIPSTWSTYLIWQYSQSVTVAGVASGLVDGDRYNGAAATTPTPADAGTMLVCSGGADASSDVSSDAPPDVSSDAPADVSSDAGLIQGTCTHDVCTAGDPLGQACDSCTMTICANDPYCCDTYWGPSCFTDVQWYCGMTC